MGKKVNNETAVKPLPAVTTSQEAAAVNEIMGDKRRGVRRIYIFKFSETEPMELTKSILGDCINELFESCAGQTMEVISTLHAAADIMRGDIRYEMIITPKFWMNGKEKLIKPDYYNAKEPTVTAINTLLDRFDDLCKENPGTPEKLLNNKIAHYFNYKGEIIRIHIDVMRDRELNTKQEPNTKRGFANA